METLSLLSTALCVLSKLPSSVYKSRHKAMLQQSTVCPGCLSYFLHHWDTVLDTRDLKEGRFTLGHGSCKLLSWLQGRTARQRGLEEEKHLRAWDPGNTESKRNQRGSRTLPQWCTFSSQEPCPGAHSPASTGEHTPPWANPLPQSPPGSAWWLLGSFWIWTSRKGHRVKYTQDYKVGEFLPFLLLIMIH